MDILIVLIVIIVIVVAITWTLLTKCHKCKSGSREDPMSTVVITENEPLPDKVATADPSSLPTIISEYLKTKHISGDISREFMDVKQDTINYALDGGDPQKVVDKIDALVGRADPTTFEHKYFLEACNMMKLAVASKKIS